MSRKSKRYRITKEKFGKEPRELAQALTLLKERASKKFDESVEMHINLGIDPKQSDQVVRGTISLPHGTGKTVKVAVFTESKTKEAKTVGADIVGGKELVDEIVKSQKTGFDVAVATPDFMREIAKAAKILGTRGLMPSPKNNTVTDDVVNVVKNLKAGQISYRNDNSGNLHQIIGKASWDIEKITDNFDAFLAEVKKQRPKGVKGAFVESITLCSTMGPGIKINL